MREPAEHSHLAGVVFKPNHIAGNKFFQHTKYNFCLILLEWEQVFWEASVKRSALRTVDPVDSCPLCPSTFRPYHSFHSVIVFQLPAAFRTDYLTLNNHNLAHQIF